MLYFNFIFLLQIILTISYYNEYKPVIGIYGNPNPEEDYLKGHSDYVPQPYINWLESLGADIMIIHQWYSEEEIKHILTKINGILFLGGGREFNIYSNWEKKALIILNNSIKNNIPLWGTCLGFELILYLISEDEKILNDDYNDFTRLHNFILNNNTINSKMFELFDERFFNILKNQNSTYYNHQKGVTQNNFYNNSKLKDFFIITSLGVDSKGNEFINSIESNNKSLNIFGVQYHPEKIPFIRIKNLSIETNNDVVRTSILLGAKFVDIARKNKNLFHFDDRDKYDFINTYENKTKCSYYNVEENIFYFKKGNEDKNDDNNNNSLIIGLLIVLALIFCIIGVLYFFKNSKNNESVDVNEGLI